MTIEQTLNKQPILDLSKRHFTRQSGDILVIGTWMMGGARPEPCLALVPAGAETAERATPCLVPLASAHLWSEELGDPAFAAEASHAFARALGFSAHNPFTCMRIAGLVRSHLQDLLTLPPMPESEKTAVAEALLRDGEGRERWSEIKSHV